jgi:hypothetical protein
MAFEPPVSLDEATMMTLCSPWDDRVLDVPIGPAGYPKPGTVPRCLGVLDDAGIP